MRLCSRRKCKVDNRLTLKIPALVFILYHTRNSHDRKSSLGSTLDIKHSSTFSLPSRNRRIRPFWNQVIFLILFVVFLYLFYFLCNDVVSLYPSLYIYIYIYLIMFEYLRFSDWTKWLQLLETSILQFLSHFYKIY